MTIPLERFVGCILGHAVGDGIGAPLEGITSDLIYHAFGRPSDIVANPPVDILHYTDDTQMTIAVAETLVACGRIEEAALCDAFVRNYDPRRGYGQGARKVIEAMAAGEDWRTLTATLFPGGSYGNGAAMRAAPIGLLFADDLDVVAEQARLSALPTHVHPLGVEGAQLLALAVALAARAPVFDHEAFYQELYSRAKSDDYRWLLNVAYQLAENDSLTCLGSSLPAQQSVVTAIACFTTSPESYTKTIARAISLGDDTDTVAAMAGAIAGASLGVSALPPYLIDRLEEQDKGRSHLEGLARQLHAVYVRRTAGG